MKVLFVTDLYPIDEQNITKALFDFVQAWKKQGHKVDVIRPNFIFNTLIRGRKIIKEKIYEKFGVRIYNINFITPFWFNVRKKLPKEFSLDNYDIMISHMPSGALMALRLLETEKIKYVCSVHSSDITVLQNFKYSFYFRQKLKKAYLIADKISARSPVLQKKIEQIIPQIQEKTFVAYSGINNIINTTDKEHKFNYRVFQICSAASLLKRKNIHVILKALAHLRLDFKFEIMGDGKEKKYLQKLAKSLNINSKIFFTGKISREQVFQKMLNNDIFILLSDNETFGLAYLEAMAAGNIVIAKKNDGIDGIIKNGQNGFLINANSSELVHCLEEIFNLKETEINKIRSNAVETTANMSSEKAAKNYLDNII